MRPESARDEPEFGDLPGILRPREQTGLIGQDAAEAAFVAALRAQRLHHAWLIGGPRGIGKATLAYRVARRLVADPRTLPDPDSLDVPPNHPAARQVAILAHPNLVSLRRVQAGSAKTMPTKIGVDAVRKALDLFGTTAGGQGGWRVCIVDSAEDLNPQSANALLKMVEEPPARAIFLIVSHAPGRLLPTIRSRCRALTLAPLSEEAVQAVIAGFPPPFVQPDAQTLAEAAALSDGSVSRALGLIDPGVAGVVREVEALVAQAGDPDWRRVLKLADTLSGRDSEALFASALDRVQRVLSSELDRRQADGPGALLPLAEASDRIANAAREAATYNLDRRPLVLSLFETLAGAMRAP